MNGEEVIVGVDVGGTNVRMGAVDRNTVLRYDQIFNSRKLSRVDAVDNLLELTKSYLRDLSQPVRALSLGFPSTLNKDRSALINTPNLKGFSNVPIRAIFEDALGIPIFINKDATMLLYYDLYKLQLAQNALVVGIYIGTGIGNSIIIDGTELIGSNGVACELGHIPVPGRRDLCGCGLRGCMELYAGGKALERICETDFPGTDIKKVFVEYGHTPQVQQFVSEIADTVVVEVDILNPDCVVLGGGVLQMEAFPKEILKREILEKTRKPIPSSTLRIEFSDGTNPFNGVIGAALYAMKQLDKGVKEK